MNFLLIMAMSRKLTGESSSSIEFGTFLWYLYAGISCLLVLFAGIMSGLTLGLMSLGLVELEILQRSGTPKEKQQAGTHLILYLFCSICMYISVYCCYKFVSFDCDWLIMTCNLLIMMMIKCVIWRWMVFDMYS